MKNDTVKRINGIYMLFGFGVVFLLGIAFLILSFAVLIPNAEVPEEFVDVEATIVEIREEATLTGSDDSESFDYTVYIDYSYGDQSFSHVELNCYDSSMREDGKVTIHVNPEDPAEFRTDSSASFIFPILSGIFAVVGAVGFVYQLKQWIETKKRREENE